MHLHCNIPAGRAPQLPVQHLHSSQAARMHFRPQCVEFDVPCRSELLRERWEAGFSITAVAATPTQFAVVLSRRAARRWSLDDKQARYDSLPTRQSLSRAAVPVYVKAVATCRAVCPAAVLQLDNGSPATRHPACLFTFLV